MSQVTLYPTYIGDEVAANAWNAGGWNAPQNSGVWKYSTHRISAPGFIGTINSVSIHNSCKSNQNTGYGVTRIKTHGSFVNGAQYTVSPGSYVDNYTTYYTNPIIGGAWTISDVADLQIGIGLFSVVDSYSQPTCNSIYVIVDFTPIGSGTPQIAYLTPIGNNSVQLTPSTGTNYQCIDEFSPSDTDYVGNSAADTYLTDLYNLTDVTASNILYVVFSLRVRRTGGQISTSGAFKHNVYTHSTSYLYPETIINNDTAATYTIVLGTNPNTGVAWTQQEITDLIFGINLKSGIAGYPNVCTWVQVYVAYGSTPPNTPSTPTGTTSGTVNVQYTYTTSATDPEGDNIYYTFDWGDGSATTNSSVVASGVSANVNHIFTTTGTFLVKAKAVDVYALESSWSNTLSVVIVSNTRRRSGFMNF